MKQFEVKLPSGDLIEGLSGQDVIELAKSGRLTGDSMIRQQGQEGWRLVRSVPQIAAHLRSDAAEVGQPSPPPASALPSIAASGGEPPQSTMRRFVGSRPVIAAVGALAAVVLALAARGWIGGDGGEADFDRGTKLLFGKGVPKDEVAAVGLLRKAAGQGHASAHLVLSKCYTEGLGVNPSPPESLKLLRKAGELGDADLQEIIGMKFILGMGVQQDYAEGAMWLRRSAQGGSVMAQWFLGVCYYEGKGVEQNFVEAVKWYRKAAEQGNPRGQFSLGLCYAKGEGLAQSDVQAIRWWRKAAEGGHPEAKQLLRGLGLQ